MSSIRVLIVDDHPLFLEGIATVIAHAGDMELVGRASSGGQAIEEFKRVVPDVTLMDLRLPDMSGIAAVSAIRGGFPDAKVIMLTTFEGDVEIQRALAAGVRAYLLKSAPLEELVQTIRKVHSGRKHLPAEVAENLVGHFDGDSLSEREIQVLRRMAEGDRNRDIGEHLSISEETVKVHIRHIMDKLGAKDRTQAVAIGVRRGVIHL
jgi:DNA-binding NarL/FixJ family response regulator